MIYLVDCQNTEAVFQTHAMLRWAEKHLALPDETVAHS